MRDGDRYVLITDGREVSLTAEEIRQRAEQLRRPDDKPQEPPTPPTPPTEGQEPPKSNDKIPTPSETEPGEPEETGDISASEGGERMSVGGSSKTQHPAPRPGGLGKEADHSVKAWYENLRLSGELDENGRPFILSPNGGIDFGGITAEHNLPAAPIRLSIGDKENGYIHINFRHGQEILNAGFNSIEEFVGYVVDNCTRIQKGSAYEKESGGLNQTYLVQLEDKHNNTLFIQLSRDGEYWNVNSAGVFNGRFGDKKENIWSAPVRQSDSSATASDGSQYKPDAEKGSSSTGNPSKIPEDKVTKSSQEKQAKKPESSDSEEKNGFTPEELGEAKEIADSFTGQNLRGELQRKMHIGYDKAGKIVDALKNMPRDKPDTEDEPEAPVPVEPTPDKPVQGGGGYTVEPTPYTNKKGKTTDCFLVKFDRELTKTERDALNEYCKEPLSAGRKTGKGWFDRVKGGWMMRSEDAAKGLADIIGDESGEAVADNAPLTLADLKAESQEPRAERPTPAPMNQVNVEDLLADVNNMVQHPGVHRGDVKLSDHSKPVEPEQPTTPTLKDVAKSDWGKEHLVIGGAGIGKEPAKPESERQVSDEEMSSLADQLRDILGEDNDGADNSILFRDGNGELTKAEKMKVFTIANFDAQRGVIAAAQQIVDEQQAQDIVNAGAAELKKKRNEQRKKDDEQKRADTEAITSQAATVASQAARAKTAKEARDAEQQIDQALDKVNGQLALLGYYEAVENPKDYNEAYGYMRNAERKAVADAAWLARQLVDDLGLDLSAATTTTDRKGKTKKKPLAKANIAPAGGDVTIDLPLDDKGNTLHMCILLSPTFEKGGSLPLLERGKGGKWDGDNLEVSGIYFRVEGPDKRWGSNTELAADVTYGDMLTEIRSVAKAELGRDFTPATSNGPEWTATIDSPVSWIGHNVEYLGKTHYIKEVRPNDDQIILKGDNDDVELAIDLPKITELLKSGEMRFIESQAPKSTQGDKKPDTKDIDWDKLRDNPPFVVTEQAEKEFAAREHGFKLGDAVVWDAGKQGKYPAKLIDVELERGMAVLDTGSSPMLSVLANWSDLSHADASATPTASKPKKGKKSVKPTDTMGDLLSQNTNENEGETGENSVNLQKTNKDEEHVSNRLDTDQEGGESDRTGQGMAGQSGRTDDVGTDASGTDGGLRPGQTATGNSGRDADGHGQERPGGTQREGTPNDDFGGLQQPHRPARPNEGRPNSGGGELAGNGGPGQPTGTGAQRPQTDGGGEGLSSGRPAAVAGQPSGPAAVSKPKPKPQPKYIRNFRYGEDGNEADHYTPLQRLNANVSALEVLTKLLEEGRPATDEERVVMSRFRGWGQVDLKNAYDSAYLKRNNPKGTALHRLGQVIDTLDPNGEKGIFDGIKRAAQTAYYTPTPIARAMNTFLPLAGFRGGKLLDPSMGSGIFEGTLPKDLQERTMITGVELDWLTGQLARALYPDADVRISGFEKAGIMPGSMDVVTSNVPFGDFSVNDPTWKNNDAPIKRSSQKKIHNYFAVKMLECAKPGGLVAMMTTRSVMDTASNQNVRQHIVEQGEFLGAIRMPDNTFQGTGAVADIIFIRKWRDDNDAETTRSNPEYALQEQLFLTLKEDKAPNKLTGVPSEVKYNSYYFAHPKNMIGDMQAGGQYSDEGFGLHSTLSVDEIAGAIEKAVKKIVGSRKGQLFNQAQTTREVRQAVTEEYQGTGDWVSNGNIIIQNGKVGTLTTTTNEYKEVTRIFEEKPTLKKHLSRFTAMGKLRTAMKQLIAAQLKGDATDETLAQLRKTLKANYDAFVARFGKLQSKENEVLCQDIDGYTIRALEKWKDGKFLGLSGMFTTNTIKPALKLDAPKTPQEAISVSLAEYGELRPDYLAKSLGEDWAGKCGDMVFEVPNTDGRYETRDEYLSGEVVKKLAAAREAAKEDPRFERNVNELLEVQPVKIPYDDIAVHFGARWIPQDIINDFVRELLGLHPRGRARYRYGENPELRSGVVYLPETDSFEVHIDKDELGGEAEEWKTGDRTAAQILGYALEDKSSNPIMRRDSDGTTWVDQDATELVNSKIEAMRERFQQWLPLDEARAKVIEDAYNERFNNTVLRKWDGSHLNVPGLMDKELRPHQKDAVWMLINARGGIVDHIVGAGKTLVMQSAIMEMRRMGIAKKPMIVALKSTVSKIAHEFKEAYPTARVLAPSDKDFQKKNRKKFIANIALNDYDCVILSHEQYCMLPHSEEAERAVIDEQLQQLDAMIEYLYGTEDKSQLTKKQIKALEKRRLNLLAKMEKRLDRSVDREFCFEDLGVDYLFVDESHQFKSVPYVTSYQRIAGLGSPEGSDKAVALLTGIRYLQKMHQGDRGTIFLSGTTITNSLVEVYNLLNYLRPRKMRELGMTTFDAWASTFAVHSSELEADTTGEFRSKDRFRNFDNVPELSQLYAEIADVRNYSNLQLPKPKVAGNTVIVPQSPEMAEINREVVKMLQNKNGSYFGIHPKDDKKEPWSLDACTISAKASISPRLVFPDWGDSSGKIYHLCEQIKKSYDEYADQKGVQLVFCELGVPGKDEKTGKPKEYDAYSDIIKRLTKEYGIPRKEIAYIQEAGNDKKRKALFQRVCNGEVRVLIGGVKNMGTGVNVQPRITDMHMLSVPWQPAALEQCIGRGARQGNMVARDFMDNKVRVWYYATEGSLDLYKYQLLDAKGKMFTAFKTGTIGGERSFDEGSADEDGNIDPAEMVAILSGNPVIFEKSKQDKLVKKLRSLQNGFLRDLQRRKAKLEDIQKSIENFERLVRLSDGDVADLKRGGFTRDENGVYPARVSVSDDGSRYGGKTFDKPKEAGEYIWQLIKDHKDVCLYGFNKDAKVVFKAPDDLQKQGTYELQMGSGDRWSIRYTVNLSQDPTAAGTAFRNLLQRVVNNNVVYKSKLVELKHQLEGARIADAKFPKQKELDEALARKRELDAEYAKLGKSDSDKETRDTGVRFRMGEGYDYERYPLGRIEPGLNNVMVKIVEIRPHDFHGSGKEATKEARQWALDNLSGKMIDASETNGKGKFVFTEKCVKKFTDPSSTRQSENLGLHLAVLKEIPKVIAESVDVETHPDFIKTDGERNPGNGYEKGAVIHRLYGAAMSEGKLYRVKITANEVLNSSKPSVPHSFEVTKIELLTGSPDGADAWSAFESMKSEALCPAAKLLKDVEMSYNPGVKILEESARENEHDLGNMQGKAAQLAAKLRTPIRIVTDPGEIETWSRRKRRAKGWYDTQTGEVCVIISNHDNVADVESTVFHEVVAHKGLRKLVGEEKYDQFLDEVYNHADDKIKAVIDTKITETEAKDIERGLSSNGVLGVAQARVDNEAKREQRRRVATDEYFADMAEKVSEEGFESLDEQELNFLQKVKKLLVKMLSSVGLPARLIVKIHDRDIIGMLRLSYLNLKENDSDVIVEARKIESQQRFHFGEGKLSMKERHDPLAASLSRSLVESALGHGSVSTVSDEQCRKELEEVKEVQLSRKQKRALETAEQSLNEAAITTVVSSADGAKVLTNLDNLASEYDQKSNRTKTFLGDLSAALGAQRHGSVSQYAHFDTVNDKRITVRLSNHNAKVSTFDQRDEIEGISIVVSPRPNGKIVDDGEAHIVEFFYSDKKLRQAPEKPLVEIIQALKQSLYSGEYKDTTGIAERQEVNAVNDGTQLHLVWHGSGAEFTAFDHSHMSKGAQFMRNSSGEVYGYVKDGRIYLNEKYLNADTPIHEYAHLWAAMVMKRQPELWRRGVELMQQLLLWQEVADKYTHLGGNPDEIASEVLSRLTGKEGERLLSQYIASQRGVIDHARAITLVGRVKEWLGEMFSHLKATLSKWSGRDLSALTAAQMRDLVLRDLAQGFDPRDPEGRGRRTNDASGPRFQIGDPYDYNRYPNGRVEPGLSGKSVRIVQADAAHGFKNTKEAEAWARENIAGTLAPEESGNKGTVVISNKAVAKFLSDSAIKKSSSQDVHLAVLKVLRDVIREGLDVETHPDFPKVDGERVAGAAFGKENLIHRVYSAVNVGGKIYRVKTTLKEALTTPDKNSRVHSYEATKIELLDDNQTALGSRRTTDVKEQSGLLRTTKLLEGVEMSYNKGVKVLEESARMDKLAENSTTARFSDSLGDLPAELPKAPERSLEEMARDLEGLKGQEWAEADRAVRQGIASPQRATRERMAASMIRLASQYANDKDTRRQALQAVGKVIGSIQQAAVAQRGYDRQTVADLVNTVKLLLGSNLIDGLTKSEISQLLTTVKDGAGMYKIDSICDRLVNIVTANQLRQARKMYDDLLNIKSWKIAASGQRVQGALDPAGQTWLTDYKRLIKTPPTAEEAADLRAQYEEALTSGDPAREADAQARLSALDTAMEHAARISAHRQARALREDQLRDVQSRLRIHAHDKETVRRLRQERKALEDAGRMADLDLSDLYRDMAQDVKNALEPSRGRVKDRIARQRQRVNDIHHDSNSDMQGREAPIQEQTVKDNTLMSTVKAMAFAPLSSWEQLVKSVWGRSAINGEGKIYDRFVNGWQRCQDRMTDNLRGVYTQLDEIARRHTAGRCKRFSDVYSLLRSGKGMEITFINSWARDGEGRRVGKEETHKLTQAGMLYIYLCDKMTDGRVKLRRMGIGDEEVEKITQALDPKVRAIFDEIQGSLLPALRERYDDTHVRMFGAHMAAIDHYFPLRIARGDLQLDDDMEKNPQEERERIMTGALIERRYNTHPLDILNTNPVSVILDHVKEMEEWNAMAEYRRDLGSLMSYTRLRQQVGHMKTVYGSGERLWSQLRDYAHLVAGAYKPKVGRFDRACVNLSKLATHAQIAFRVATAIKQTLSYPAFASEASARRLMLNIVRPAKCWKWAMENMPNFRERWLSRQAGNEKLRDSDLDWAYNSRKLVRAAQRWGMSPNAFVDAMTVAAGSEAVYRSRLKDYTDAGMDKEQARERAIIDAERTFNLSQQSSQLPYLSLLQNDRTFLSTVTTVFRNASMSYGRQLYDAGRSFGRSLDKGARDKMITYEAKRLIEAGADPEKAMAVAQRKYRRQMRRDLIRLTTMAYVLPTLWILGGQAYGLLLSDDDKKRRETLDDALARGLLGAFEGLPTGGSSPDIAYNFFKGESLNAASGGRAGMVGDLPAVSQMWDVVGDMDRGMGWRAANRAFNLWAQLQSGVNPQVAEDAVLAVMDYATSERNADDMALMIGRILQYPQSQLRQVALNDLDLDRPEEAKLTPSAVVERLAEIQARRDNMAGWLACDQERWAEMRQSYDKRYTREAKERMERMSSPEVEDVILRAMDEYKELKKTRAAAQAEYDALLDKDGNETEAAQRYRMHWQASQPCKRYHLLRQYVKQHDAAVGAWLQAATPTEAAKQLHELARLRRRVARILQGKEAMPELE